MTRYRIISLTALSACLLAGIIFYNRTSQPHVSSSHNTIVQNILQMVDHAISRLPFGIGLQWQSFNTETKLFIISTITIIVLPLGHFLIKNWPKPQKPIESKIYLDDQTKSQIQKSFKEFLQPIKKTIKSYAKKINTNSLNVYIRPDTVTHTALIGRNQNDIKWELGSNDISNDTDYLDFMKKHGIVIEQPLNLFYKINVHVKAYFTRYSSDPLFTIYGIQTIINSNKNLDSANFQEIIRILTNKIQDVEAIFGELKKISEKEYPLKPLFASNFSKMEIYDDHTDKITVTNLMDTNKKEEIKEEEEIEEKSDTFSTLGDNIQLSENQINSAKIALHNLLSSSQVRNAISPYLKSTSESITQLGTISSSSAPFSGSSWSIEDSMITNNKLYFKDFLSKYGFTSTDSNQSYKLPLYLIKPSSPKVELFTIYGIQTLPNSESNFLDPANFQEIIVIPQKHKKDMEHIFGDLKTLLTDNRPFNPIFAKKFSRVVITKEEIIQDDDDDDEESVSRREIVVETIKEH